MTPRLSPTCFSVGGVVSRSCSTWIAAFSENGSRSTTVMRIGCAWRFFTVVLNSRRSVLVWPIQDGSFSRRRSGTRVTFTLSSAPKPSSTVSPGAVSRSRALPT